MQTPRTDAWYLAAEGYAAYRVAAGGLNFAGDTMPYWTDLPEKQRTYWWAAAIRIRHEVLQEVRTTVTELATP